MITRRDFLKQSSMLAAAGLLPVQSLRAQSDVRVPESERFPMDVACGDVTYESAILWTYYEGIYPLKLVLWASDEEPVWCSVKRAEGGFVHHEIQDLSPHKSYHYAFYEVDFSGKSLARSVIGRFKSAPDPDSLVSLKLGAVSCVRNWFEPTLLEDAGSRSDLDLFLHNGDSSYNDGSESLDEFRGSWLKTLSRRGCQMLRRNVSMVATIDDHEIEDNFNAETIGHRKFEAAMQAFFEHMPMRRTLENPNQIWRKLSWGGTLDIFVLDCRSERRPSQKQYISAQQMNWLKTSLSASKAMFKIIMNPVPITDFYLPMAWDRWEGYPEQRDEILEFIDHHSLGKNLLWVSGDFHFGSYGRVSRFEALAGYNQWEVLAGPISQSPNPAGFSVKGSVQFKWTRVRQNYVTITCDTKNERFEVEPVYL